MNSYIPLEKRYQAVLMYFQHGNDGQPLYQVQEICDQFKISESELYRLVDKWEETGSLRDRKRSGRPHKASSTGIDRLVILTKKNPFSTFAQLSETYNEGLPEEEHISLWEVKLLLRTRGIEAFWPTKKTALTPEEKNQRKNWAKDFLKLSTDFFRGVVFTDESFIRVEPGISKVKVKANKKERY